MEYVVILAFTMGWIVAYVQEHYRRDIVNSTIAEMEKVKHDYLVYRGSSFDENTGQLFWAKDDAAAYAEGIDSAINIVKKRMER